MHCDYCGKGMMDLAESRRHFLSMEHMAKKNNYELTTQKFFERERQAIVHPSNFDDLCTSLNMHSRRDVIALEKDGFFKLERLWHCNVAEELMKVLMDTGITYHLDRIPQVVREKLLRCLEEEKQAKEAAREAAKEAARVSAGNNP